MIVELTDADETRVYKLAQLIVARRKGWKKVDKEQSRLDMTIAGLRAELAVVKCLGDDAAFNDVVYAKHGDDGCDVKWRGHSVQVKLAVNAPYLIFDKVDYPFAADVAILVQPSGAALRLSGWCRRDEWKELHEVKHWSGGRVRQVCEPHRLRPIATIFDELPHRYKFASLPTDDGYIKTTIFRSGVEYKELWHLESVGLERVAEIAQRVIRGQ